jgi:DNA-binding NtrC family response regulator
MLREGLFTLGPGAARGWARCATAWSIASTPRSAWRSRTRTDCSASCCSGRRSSRKGSRSTESVMLEAIGSLTAQALAGRSPAPSRPAPRLRARRSMQALHEAHPPLRSLVGSSEALLEVCLDLIDAASTHSPALLMGESGSGKELAARAIHELSDRAQGAYEVVDCGAIARDLIESELFGHVRGAFTGAHRDRRGMFELARHGTLFLDEIGELPLQLQTRLLRVVQEGRFRRVGDDHSLETDARIVTATNRDLHAEVMAGRFREDLYHRLNVITVRMPPLRERIADIPILFHHVLAQHGQKLGVRSLRRRARVFEALAVCPWSGNVRQLANLCALLVARMRDRKEIEIDDLERAWRKQNAGEPPWLAGAAAPAGSIGSWVLASRPAHRFNLLLAEQVLRRKARSGATVPLAERSALSYY